MKKIRYFLTFILFSLFVQLSYTNSNIGLLQTNLNRLSFRQIEEDLFRFGIFATGNEKRDREIHYWATIQPNESLIYSAYHEAAHALIAFLLGFTVKDVNVLAKKYFNKIIYTGFTTIMFPVNIKNNSDILDRICVYLAGGIATKILFGTKFGLYSDNKKVDSYLKDLDSKRECKEKTKRIILENMALLDKIANRLIEKGRISSGEFLAIFN